MSFLLSLIKLPSKSRQCLIIILGIATVVIIMIILSITTLDEFDVNTVIINIDSASNTGIIDHIINIQTGESHHCSFNRFKYLSLILSSIKQYKNKYNIITSMDIDKYRTANEMQQSLRIKIVNGKLYIPIDLNLHQDGVLIVLSYFYRLLLKYGEYISDTDFLFGWDCQTFNRYTYAQQNNWIDNNFPFFISEGAALNESKNIYPLYLVSRGWLSFEHHREELWMAECWHRNNIHASKWEDKLNIIEFRGSVNGPVRLPIVKQIIDKYGKNDIENGYNVGLINGNSDRKYQMKRQNLTQEFMHKYILMIDGYSVRDGFHKQAMYGSLIFKDRSFNKEWWYYDLIDNETVIYYDNINNLIEMVNEKIEIVKQWEIYKNELYRDQYFHLKNIAQNIHKYYKENLWNRSNIDCFVIQMLQIYNEYLYNGSTVKLDSNKDTEFCFDAKCKHFQSETFQRNYQSWINEQYYCKYDNITDKYCQFC